MMVAYSPAVSGPALYEDVQSLAPQAQIAPASSRSLTAWSFRLTPTSSSAHLGNLALHGLNGLVLSALLLSLTTPFPAWCLTTLFLVHPLQSEAVAYITGRGELLAGLGVLLVWWGIVRVVSGWKASLLVALGGLMALSAKEATGASLLLWLPLLAWTFGRWGRVALPLALWGALALWYARLLPPMPVASLAWMARQSAAVWHLARLALWPVGLSIETPPPFLPWLALASFVAACVAVILPATLPKPLRFAGLWVAAGLLPRIVLHQPLPLLPEPLHEHHAYTLLLGCCLAGWSWRR